MKSSSIFLSLLFLMSFSTLQAQWGKIKGEGPMVSETLELDEFTSIGLGISADVVLTQGKSQKVEIKGQKNIIENIKTRVKGSSWSIEFEDSAQDYKKLTIEITMSTLEAVSVGGSGNIRTTNHFSSLDDVHISIGGSGDVDLDMDAKDVAISIGGSGQVELEGKGDDLKISIGGSGDVSAFDFSVSTCKVSSAGSGDIDVNVSDDLKVSLVGSGDVTYKGSPRIKSSIVGSGDVEKLN